MRKFLDKLMKKKQEEPIEAGQKYTSEFLKLSKVLAKCTL